MTEVTVHPGICGLKTTIQIDVDDTQNASITILSECSGVKQMEKELKDIDCMKECFSKFETSKIYQAAANHCSHVSCPVPMAIIKGLEVACGFALPKDVSIHIQK